MKKNIRGSFTIEAAVIVPIILLIFSVLMYLMFYFHDKNVLMGVAHETLAVGCGRKGLEDHELEQYFSSRIQGKLLLFTRVKSEIERNKEQVQIVCNAQKGSIKLEVEYKMKQTEPEDYIRSIRKMIKMQEGIEKEW